jgi:hypothetical protein
MSKSRKSKRKAEPPAQTARGRRFPGWAIAALGFAVLAVGGFWWSKGQRAGPSAEMAQAGQTNPANEPAPGSSLGGGFTKLKGRWLRPDGGYVLEVSNVDAAGKMEAGYFNPKPIHVAGAQASQDGPSTKVFVELRDVNYPGSTYNLVYDPASDQLKGIYFQAALQQSFEVLFERLK